LSCYPDYGKASREYVIRITDTLATFPEWVLVRMCDLRRGVAAQCEFLPTVAAINKIGDKIIAEQRHDDEAAAAAAESATREQWEQEERAEQAKLQEQREGALKRAREKFKTAHLNAAGELCYMPEIEQNVRCVLLQPDPIAYLKANWRMIPALKRALSWYGIEVDAYNQPYIERPDLQEQVNSMIKAALP
jgi:hypothetical protein